MNFYDAYKKYKEFLAYIGNAIFPVSLPMFIFTIVFIGVNFGEKAVDSFLLWGIGIAIVSVIADRLIEGE